MQQQKEIVKHLFLPIQMEKFFMILVKDFILETLYRSRSTTKLNSSSQ